MPCRQRTSDLMDKIIYLNGKNLTLMVQIMLGWVSGHKCMIVHPLTRHM